jgi:UDP-N-acetylglucosamine 2-epimerase
MSIKIMSIIGARPQFIKAAPVSHALVEVGIQEKLVHTGQHHDKSMSDVFFDELGIPAPEYNLAIQGGSHGAMTGKMLEAIEEVLLKEKPDRVLVYGDTNSTLAGALAAVKLHIPVIHVEAGLRSFNRSMPEEINRIMTDHVSDLLLCTSDVAVGHLKNEGITNGVHLVGDVMADINRSTREGFGDLQDLLNDYGLEEKKYILMTWHRAENTDDRDRLLGIAHAVNAIQEVVVLPLHPRTRKALDREGVVLDEHVKVVEPLSYHHMTALLMNSRCMLTDSGGVQKEAYWCHVPCITMRDETEWTETVDVGWNCLVGADEGKILRAVNNFVPPKDHPVIYGDGHAAKRIAELLRDA